MSNLLVLCQILGWVDLTVGEIVFASEGVKKENSFKGL